MNETAANQNDALTGMALAAPCSSHCFPCVYDRVTAFVLSLDEYRIGNLPRVSGVYFVVDDTDCVQYVGCAVDVRQRWRGHKLKGVCREFNWRIFVKEVDFDHFLSKEHEEAFFIATLRPSYNQSLKCRVHG